MHLHTIYSNLPDIKYQYIVEQKLRKENTVVNMDIKTSQYKTPGITRGSVRNSH